MHFAMRPLPWQMGDPPPALPPSLAPLSQLKLSRQSAKRGCPPVQHAALNRIRVYSGRYLHKSWNLLDYMDLD